MKILRRLESTILCCTSEENGRCSVHAHQNQNVELNCFDYDPYPLEYILCVSRDMSWVGENPSSDLLKQFFPVTQGGGNDKGKQEDPFTCAHV